MTLANNSHVQILSKTILCSPRISRSACLGLAGHYLISVPVFQWYMYGFLSAHSSLYHAGKHRYHNHIFLGLVLCTKKKEIYIKSQLFIIAMARCILHNLPFSQMLDEKYSFKLDFFLSHLQQFFSIQILLYNKLYTNFLRTRPKGQHNISKPYIICKHFLQGIIREFQKSKTSNYSIL